MAIRLTTSRLRQIIREEIRVMTEAPNLVSSDVEGSASEQRVVGLKYQSADALSNAVDNLMNKLASTKHPKSPTGRSYGVTIMLGMTDPKYQRASLKMFNDFAANAGFNHPDDEFVKSHTWTQLGQDLKAVRPDQYTPIPMKSNFTPWSQT